MSESKSKAKAADLTNLGGARGTRERTPSLIRMVYFVPNVDLVKVLRDQVLVGRGMRHLLEAKDTAAYQNDLGLNSAQYAIMQARGSMAYLQDMNSAHGEFPDQESEETKDSLSLFVESAQGGTDETSYHFPYCTQGDNPLANDNETALVFEIDINSDDWTDSFYVCSVASAKSPPRLGTVSEVSANTIRPIIITAATSQDQVVSMLKPTDDGAKRRILEMTRGPYSGRMIFYAAGGPEGMDKKQAKKPFSPISAPTAGGIILAVTPHIIDLTQSLVEIRFNGSQVSAPTILDNPVFKNIVKELDRPSVRLVIEGGVSATSNPAFITVDNTGGKSAHGGGGGGGGRRLHGNAKVAYEMHKFKKGELHSGSKHGPLLKYPEDREQALAISLSVAGKSNKRIE